MNSALKNWGILVVAGFLAACATSEHGEVRLRNSDLSNFNPAPKSMSPVVSDDPVIDPTHVKAQADYHFALGEALSLDGESEKAMEEFKLATVYDTESAVLRLRLATEYLKQGLLTESVEHAEAALKLEPENIEVHIFLGNLYATLKMHRQANEMYQFVLKKEPNHQDVPLFLGALAVDQDHFDEAEAYFLKAATVPDGEKHHLAYFYIGKMRASQGEAYYKKAESAFSKALEQSPGFDEAALALAELYAQKNERPKAFKLLESFQEQFGPRKSVAFQLSQMYLDDEKYDLAFRHLQTLEAFEPGNLNVKVKVALILIEQKKFTDAIAKLEEIVTVAPTSDKIRFYLAAVYEETGKQDLAIDNYRRIEPSSTYYPDAVVHAAYLYRKKHDLGAAAALMKRAIDQRDDVPQFYSFYASILDEQKEYKAGVAMLEKATAKFADNSQLRFYLGSLYERVGRFDDSIEQMRKILTADGNHVQALNFLAYTLAEQGKSLEEAEQLARKAMSLQPDDGYILDTVGWTLFKQGRTEEAIQYLEAAVRLKPEESVIAEHLGDAYYVFELADKAKQMYIKAVSFESDPTKVTKIKAKIVLLDTSPKSDRVPASAGGR